MNIWMSLLVSSLLAGLAIYKKALTRYGVLIAWICSVGISYFGGMRAFLILAVTFLMTLVGSKLFAHKKESQLETINEKHGTRDAMQIIANVGVGFLSMTLYGITKDPLYFIIYGSVMASSLADSMASEIGILSKGKSLDLCTLKPLEKGLSGGVSLLGLIASLVGSGVIAMITVVNQFSIATFFFILLLGAFGAFFDSVLGSLFQVKYKCKSCGKLTERKIHCQESTIYVRGFHWMNNDMVNLCNNMMTFILAILLYQG